MKPLKEKIRTVAHLQKADQQNRVVFDGIISTIQRGRVWQSGFEITTPFGGLISPVTACFRCFFTEHKAVYDAIRCIKDGTQTFDSSARSFIEELCDLAFDNINPKLF